MLSGLIWTALMDKAMKEVPEEPFAGRETIHLWYTDSALTDYLNSVSVAYNESQDRFRAEPSLRSGVEFLEEINTENMHAIVGKIVNVSAEESVIGDKYKILPEKVNALIFDQYRSGYFAVGEKVGQAWNAGAGLMKKAAE